MIRVNYIDASALVKLFDNEERRSQEVRNYLGPPNVFMTTSVCFFETLGVLGRKYKSGNLTQEKYLCACEELLALIRDDEIHIHDVNVLTREAFSEVDSLVQLYRKGKKKQLDLSDAFQLVTLRRVFPDVAQTSKFLVTADCYLAEAARAEGITVWNVLTEDPPPC
jgi:predicted nucleic acid-binding protein